MRITEDDVGRSEAETGEFTEPPTTPSFTPQNSERAFDSRFAGEFLAELVGRATAFSSQQMYAMARANQIPVIRIGRRVIFQKEALAAFVAAGGSPRAKR